MAQWLDEQEEHKQTYKGFIIICSCGKEIEAGRVGMAKKLMKKHLKDNE